jgi:hypothetical protein
VTILAALALILAAVALLTIPLWLAALFLAGRE